MTETKPVIIAVDDEPEVVQAVQRDLRARYASDYRIVWASGGQEAIDTLRSLALQDTPVALMLVDQRMPGVTGIDVLRETLSSTRPPSEPCSRPMPTPRPPSRPSTTSASTTTS